MYCSAAATVSIRSPWRMMVGMGVNPSEREILTTSGSVAIDPERSAFARFFAHESAGGIVLAFAALAALLVSNSPWRAHYEAFVHWPGELSIGGVLVLSKPLLLWGNDPWMGVFF